ncbi:hypothetical protein pb186bvf_000833 [Paramecium bursaria]
MQFFNFIKTLVGIVILDLPYASNKCGFVLASIILIVVSYATIRTSIMLIESAEKININQYSKITKEVLGSYAQITLDLFLIMQQVSDNLSVCIAYIIFFLRFCQLSLSYVDIEIHPFYCLIISSIVLLPLSLVKDIQFFHATSTLGFLMAIFVLCMISIQSIPKVGKIDVKYFDFGNLFQFLGIAIFSYEGICTALPIRESMDEKSLFKNVFYQASIACLVLYVGFISINVMALGDSLNEIILLNLPKTGLSFLLQLTYAISILLTYPVQINPAFQVMEQRILEKVEGISYVARVLTTILLYCISYFIPNFSKFLNILGIIFGTCLQFIFPVLIYIKVHDQINIVKQIEIYSILSISITAALYGLIF